MTKVHPNSITSPLSPTPCEPPTVLTVWNKSLLFNCRGFAVYNSAGDLVFRVDTYASRRTTSSILLMDAVGLPLLTIRRKRLSLEEQWVAYEGEEASEVRFKVRKGKGRKVVARVEGEGWGYAVEGSYVGRSCVVYEEGSRRKAAEIRRKEERVGSDVFALEVEGKMEEAIAMAVVVVLEQMYGSSSR